MIDRPVIVRKTGAMAMSTTPAIVRFRRVEDHESFELAQPRRPSSDTT